MALTIVAIIFNAIDLKRYAVFAMICNLVMGWELLCTSLAIKALTWDGFYIFSWRILYTIGQYYME